MYIIYIFHTFSYDVISCSSFSSLYHIVQTKKQWNIRRIAFKMIIEHFPGLLLDILVANCESWPNRCFADPFVVWNVKKMASLYWDILGLYGHLISIYRYIDVLKRRVTKARILDEFCTHTLLLAINTTLLETNIAPENRQFFFFFREGTFTRQWSCRYLSRCKSEFCQNRRLPEADRIPPAGLCYF